MRVKVDKLDVLFSKYIRLKAGSKCEYCGRMVRLECSHFHGRRKRSTRYDSDNACALCFSCHQYLGENPYQHTEFFKKRLGTDRFEELNIRAETIRCNIDKEEMANQLRDKIAQLEKGEK